MSYISMFTGVKNTNVTSDVPPAEDSTKDATTLMAFARIPPHNAKKVSATPAPPRDESEERTGDLECPDDITKIFSSTPKQTRPPRLSLALQINSQTWQKYWNWRSTKRQKKELNVEELSAMSHKKMNKYEDGSIVEKHKKKNKRREKKEATEPWTHPVNDQQV